MANGQNDLTRRLSAIARAFAQAKGRLKDPSAGGEVREAADKGLAIARVRLKAAWLAGEQADYETAGEEAEAAEGLIGQATALLDQHDQCQADEKRFAAWLKRVNADHA